VINLTDAELALIDAEHYPHPDGGGDCLYCCRVWPCIESRAVAELRELRAENERLRAEDASWEEREAACCPEDVGFEDMIRYLRADVARLRAALIEIRGNTVISPGLGYGCRTVVNAIRELVDAALANVKGGDA